jgi:hypothetical protein
MLLTAEVLRSSPTLLVTKIVTAGKYFDKQIDFKIEKWHWTHVTPIMEGKPVEVERLTFDLEAGRPMRVNMVIIDKDLLV